MVKVYVVADVAPYEAVSLDSLDGARVFSDREAAHAWARRGMEHPWIVPRDGLLGDENETSYRDVPPDKRHPDHGGLTGRSIWEFDLDEGA